MRPQVLVAAPLILAVLLAGCGRTSDMAVRTMPAPGPAPPPPAMSPSPPVMSPPAMSKFQGEVRDVDVAAGEFLLAVQIVWTPVLKADRHDRRIVVEAGTRWEPAPGTFAALRSGDDVQVEGEELGGGRWRAASVLLLDID